MMTGSSTLEFSREGLTVSFVPDNASVAVVFKGKSDSRNPAGFFEEFTPKLLERSAGKKIYLDFRTLEYMNSATVSPVLSLVRTLDTHAIETVLLFDVRSDWQRINFRCMKVITKALAHVKVTE